VRRATASVQRLGIPRHIVRLAAAVLLAAIFLAVFLPGAVHAWPVSGTVSVHDAAAENGERLRALSRPFTIVALPDTQIYSALDLIEFDKQIEWVLAHAAEKNIVFVTHLGDVVDNGKAKTDWANARDALAPLLAQDRLPFSIVRGNHDDPEYFLRYLPPSLMRDKPWFVDADPSGFCQVQKFQVQGAWFLHIGIRVWPSDAELEWANDLLQEPEYKGLPVIVTTHDYLEGGGKSKHGWRIWNALVKDNPQVFMVLCGHIAKERAFVSYNAEGLPVYELLSDYQQFRPFGGNGLLRLITIDPARDTIEVKTFSPYFRYESGRETDTDYYETDRDSQFAFSLADSAMDLNERLAFGAGSGSDLRFLALSSVTDRVLAYAGE
jgi:3',5'-cyclic AMP phosphodiesterase CpdA